MLENIFKQTYPTKNGVLYCLSAESETHDIKKVEIETYTIRADEFSEQKMLRLSDQEYEALDPVRDLPRGAHILELGGGDARFAFQLMREGYEVIESDIAPGSVQKAKEIAEKNNLIGGTYAVIDAEDLPFKDGTLDAIFIVATFHHLPDTRKALTEFHRVLKPNGKILLLREPASWQYTVFGPVYEGLRHVLRSRNHNEISHADDETHGFSRKTIRELLGAQFTDIQLIPVQYTEKIYLNYVTLKSKFFKKKYLPGKNASHFLQAIDGIISKIPILKNTPWDWDIVARKK